MRGVQQRRRRPNPTPSFASPFATEATVTFAPVDEAGGRVAGAQLFVGDYQARAVPVADTVGRHALADHGAARARARTTSWPRPRFGLARVGPVTVTAGQPR